MSILIKGIDLPKEGEVTFIAIKGKTAIETYKGVNVGYYSATQIPTPHGRIIDEKELKDLYSQMPFNDNEIRFSKNDIYCNLWNIKTILELEE